MILFCSCNRWTTILSSFKVRNPIGFEFIESDSSNSIRIARPTNLQLQFSKFGELVWSQYGCFANTVTCDHWPKVGHCWLNLVDKAAVWFVTNESLELLTVWRTLPMTESHCLNKPAHLTKFSSLNARRTSLALTSVNRSFGWTQLSIKASKVTLKWLQMPPNSLSKCSASIFHLQRSIRGLLHS